MFAKRFLFTLLFAGGVAVPTPAYAWANHDLITREILRHDTWLNGYRHLKVTKWTYADVEKGNNPDYKPPYIDKLVGDMTNAREILIRYVDEPDWGMDTALDLSPLQAVTGGSKGYRHQCYHFLNGAVTIGEAPKRCKFYYELSRTAFRKHDPYWGFRYLARSIHYLEDMGEPYHTRPILWSYLLEAKGDLKKVATMATNAHDYYEAYVSRQLLKQESKGKGSWIQAIEDAGTADVFDPEAAASALGDFASERSKELLEACDRFFPKRDRSMKALQPIRSADLDPAEPPPSYGTIDEITTLDLHVTSAMVRGLMALAKQDVLVLPKPSDDE